MHDPAVYAAAHRETLHAVAEVCAGLTGEQWAAATGCPGWSVHDQVAHICDVESLILGDRLVEPPSSDVSGRAFGPHVVNPIGERMELGVEARRGWRPDRLLDELRSITERRLPQLEAVTGEQLGETAHGHPFGPMPLHRFLTLRVMDLFSHEQDIRRAVARPGGGDGPAAEVVVPFAFKALARQLFDRVPELHGRRMHLDVEGTTGTLDFTGERGEATTPAAEAEWAMVFDIGTFMAWIGGRSDRTDFAWYGREPAGDDLRLAHEAFRAHAGMTP